MYFQKMKGGGKGGGKGEVYFHLSITEKIEIPLEAKMLTIF